MSVLPTLLAWQVRNVNARDAAGLMKAGWVLLDVRPPTEVKRARAVGAVEVSGHPPTHWGGLAWLAAMHSTLNCCRPVMLLVPHCKLAACRPGGGGRRSFVRHLASGSSTGWTALPPCKESCHRWVH